MRSTRLVSVEKWIGTAAQTSERHLAEETAIAIVYNGTTHAVMMASPQDLHDFALGFALTEGLIEDERQCERFELVRHANGIEARFWIEQARAEQLAARRRQMAGPTGCGLCGIESLEQAIRPVDPVASTAKVAGGEVPFIMSQLQHLQALNSRTRAVHAAALWTNGEIGMVREDVGRHNALDKLIGAARRRPIRTDEAVLLLTSRLSIEMVQKAAAANFGIVVAISAPTAAALALAEAVGITLIGIARSDGFEVFTHPERVLGPGEKGQAHTSKFPAAYRS